MSNSFSAHFRVHRVFATVLRRTGEIQSVQSFDATCCRCGERGTFAPSTGLEDDGVTSELTCRSCTQVATLFRKELATMLDDQQRRDLLLLANRT